MAWVASTGNDGAYRIAGSGIAALPRTAKPLSLLIDHVVASSRAGATGTGGAHVEWKVPIAVANQTGTQGAFIGPQQQDSSLWESFVMKNDGNLDFNSPAPTNPGLPLRLGTWIRVVMTAGNHGTTGGGTSTIVGRPGAHLYLHRGQQKTGTNTIDALDRLSIGYAATAYVRNNGTGTNDTPPVGGMLITPQPMLQHTIFSKAAFYDRELPSSIMEELARGRHPLDLPRAYWPREFYPMNNPAETAPRCVLTGNTMTISGSFQYLTSDYLTTNSLKLLHMDSPSYVEQAWKKNGMAKLVAALTPVTVTPAGPAFIGGAVRSPISSAVRGGIRAA